MGCLQGKSKRNQESSQMFTVVSENITQSQSLQLSQNVQAYERKVKMKWISQNIPTLQLHESELYRRRKGIVY